MEQTQDTKASWTIIRREPLKDEDYLDIRGPVDLLGNANIIATIYRTGDGDVEATARLIAAAPEIKEQRDELLEAAQYGLERMEAELKNCGGVSGYLEPKIEFVKAAIAKAEQGSEIERQ